VIADDFAFGHENVAGFQRVFEDNGGKVVQKLWTPLNAPDYGTYISQLKPNLDAVYTGHAGSNGFKFIRSCGNTATRCKSSAASRRSTNRCCSRWARRARRHTGNWYSAELDFPINKKFVEAIQATTRPIPASTPPRPIVCGEVLEHALKTIGGKAEDKDAFMKALREAKVPNTLRGRCGSTSSATWSATSTSARSKEGRRTSTR
jgi:ABC-type branched-chain amino acid transport systems, periplasmic component